MMNQSSKLLTFPEAIAQSQKIMQQIAENQLNEAEIEDAISSLVSSQTGARGFFVAYLTSDLSLADRPTEGVIKGLRSSPVIVSDLLVKNVAMSVAMKLAHLRNQDETAAAGSQRVADRSTNLIEQLQIPQTKQQIKDLQSTIMKGEGSYQKFLARWGYDKEQQEKICDAVTSINTRNI